MSLYTNLLLPNELLRLIAEKLKPGTFCNFMQSCKLFRSICDQKLLCHKQLEYCVRYKKDLISFIIQHNNLELLKFSSRTIYLKCRYSIIVDNLDQVKNSAITTYLLDYLIINNVLLTLSPSLVQENNNLTSMYKS